MRTSKSLVIALTLVLSTCWLGAAHAAAAPQHFTETPLTINGNYQPLEGDFNGDGLSDVLWYCHSTFRQRTAEVFRQGIRPPPRSPGVITQQ